MLHMEILRSPLAHARITLDRRQQGLGHPRRPPRPDRRDDGQPQPGLDAHAVLRHPGRPGHRQGPLPGPGGRLRHRRRPLHRQGRLRGDRRRLRAAARRSSTPRRRMAEGAPLIRDDKENQHDNVVFDWEVGDKDGTDRAFAEADVVSKLEMHYPRSHPSPIECCGSIADFNRATSKLTVYMTTQAPHIIRAAVALVAELPEHMIRIVSPDLGGGFGNKVPVYPGLRDVDPGLDPAGAPGEVDRGQDRQPDLHRLRPRHLPPRRDGAAQGRQDPRRADAHRLGPRRLLLRRPAEQVQDRADALGLRLLRHPGRPPHRSRRLHQQGAGRRRLPVLVPGHRGDVLPGAHGPGRGRRPRHGPGRVPAHQLRPRRRLPAPHAVRLPHRLGPVRQVPRHRAGSRRLPGLPARRRRRPKPRAACSASASRP